jgi:hypothetical protein
LLVSTDRITRPNEPTSIPPGNPFGQTPRRHFGEDLA